MKASGEQLRELAALYDAGVLKPVLDPTAFPFSKTIEAMAYVEQGKRGEGRRHSRLTNCEHASAACHRT